MEFIIPFKVSSLILTSSGETYSLRGLDRDDSFFLASLVQGHKLKYLWVPNGSWRRLEKAPKGLPSLEGSLIQPQRQPLLSPSQVLACEE